MLGRLKKYEECLSVSNMGIKYCKKYSFGKSLTRLFYSCSIALKKLGNNSKSEYFSSLCLANVISFGDFKEINIFYNLLNKDFDKDPFDILYSHKEDILKGETEL